jgi:hypothetical protein
MKDSERFKLRLGKYKTPKFEYDDIVFDEAYGEVRIVGLTDALIPWPIGQPLNDRSRRILVLFDALTDAVKQEANQAVAHWWGVSGQTVTKWRKALDVGKTPGTTILREERGRENFPKIRERLLSKSADPVRREKIAASRRGKKRPKHVMEILRLSNIGRKASDETRKKLSDANKRRGTRPPKAGKAWTEHEEELARTLPIPEVVRLTGRTYSAVKCRRKKLGVPDGRRRKG